MSEIEKVNNGALSMFGNVAPVEDVVEIVTDLSSDDAAFYQMGLAGVRIPDPKRNFRQCKAAADTVFTWLMPGSDLKEVAAQVVGLRGVVVDVGHGFMLFNSSEKKFYCGTIGAVPDLGPAIHDSSPFPLPIYGPEEYNEDRPSREPVRDLLRINPIGSRGFSCADCVRNGLNRFAYKDAKGAPQEDTCGGTTNLIMIVMQLGVQKNNLALRQSETVWINVTEFSDSDGNKPFDKPFPLNLSLSRSTVTKSASKMGVKVQPNSPVPSGVETWGRFLENAYSSSKVVPAKGGHLVYDFVTEVWAGQPTDQQDISQMIKSIPVFRVVPEEEVVELSGASTRDWRNVAIQLYRAAYCEAGGVLDENNWPKRQERSLTTKTADDVAQLAAKEAGKLPPIAPAKTASTVPAGEAIIDVNANPFNAGNGTANPFIPVLSTVVEEADDEQPTVHTRS